MMRDWIVMIAFAAGLVVVAAAAPRCEIAGGIRMGGVLIGGCR